LGEDSIRRGDQEPRNRSDYPRTIPDRAARVDVKDFSQQSWSGVAEYVRNVNFFFRFLDLLCIRHI